MNLKQSKIPTKPKKSTGNQPVDPAELFLKKL